MEPAVLLIAGLVLLAGSILQSAAGFGIGLFAIPLIIMLGVDPPVAMVIVATSAAAQNIVGAVTFRSHIEWRQVAWMVGIAGATIPLGVFVLGQIVELGEGRIRQIFGLLVLGALVTQWIARIEPRDHVPWPWGVFALAVSGFTTGLAGMGGPPLVLWIIAHAWSTERSRGTMWALFTGLFPVQFIVLYANFGPAVPVALGWGAALVPFTLLGIPPGLWIGRRMSTKVLHRVCCAMLLIVAMIAILQPWLRGA